MKAYGGIDGIAPFLTSVLDGGKRSISNFGHFPHGLRASGNHFVGGWVNPKAGQDAVDKR
jgi:hypothetical protein